MNQICEHIQSRVFALSLYRAIDPDMWGKMIGRVNGVNFAGIYGKPKKWGRNPSLAPKVRFS